MHFARIKRARRTRTIPQTMAEIMQEAVACSGSCTAEDLIGFTADEIAAHGDKARQLAEQLSEKQISGKAA